MRRAAPPLDSILQDPHSPYTASSCIQDAWQRHNARDQRARDVANRLDGAIENAFSLTMWGLALAGALLTATVLLIVAEILTSSDWGALVPWVMLGLGAAMLVAAAPIPVALAYGATLAYSWASLTLETMRATRSARAAGTIPLRDAVWAVYCTSVPLLSRRGAPREYLRMSERAGRAIAGRYGSDAKPGGRLHELAMLPLGLRFPLVRTFNGSAEEFLQETRSLDQQAWETLLEVSRRAGAATYGAADNECDRHTRELIGEMRRARLDESQRDAMLTLAPTWRGELSALVRSAAAL